VGSQIRKENQEVRIMAYRPNFKNLVQSNVIGSSNPFRYVRIANEAHWETDDNLILEDLDWSFKTSGEFQCIVKPDWDVRFRIRTENWGGFGGVMDEMGEERAQAYNVVVDNPFLATGRWKSSLEFTLRGDGMLGVWVDGANASEVWGVGAFDDEVRYRLGGSPTPTIFNNGFFISFTHPYGEYTDRGTYTLKINDMDRDCMIEILAVEERKDVATRPVDDSSQHEPVSAYDILKDGTIYDYKSGEDSETGYTWVVQVLEYQGSWWVVANGELINFYATRAEAENAAENYISEIKRRQEEDDDVIPEFDPTLPLLGIGILGIGVLLAVVYVASR
jgi:hypothetical protein